MKLKKTYLAIAVFSLMFTFSLTQANALKIEQAEVVPSKVSPGSNSLLKLQLSQDGSLVNSESCGGLSPTYVYDNKEREMTYSGESGVFLADFKAKQDNVNFYTSSYNCDNINNNEIIEQGSNNIGVELQNNFSQGVVGGSEINLKAEVEVPASEDKISVNYKFYNPDGSLRESGSMSPTSSSFIYEASFKVPNKNKAYYATIEVSGDVDSDPYTEKGGSGVLIDVYRSVNGEIELEPINENKCNQQLTKCERGTNLYVKFTNVEQNPTEVKAYITNEEGTETYKNSFPLTDHGDKWVGDFEIKDSLEINSKFPKLRVVINASNEESSITKEKIIDIVGFKVEPDFPEAIFQKETASLKLDVKKKISGNRVDSSIIGKIDMNLLCETTGSTKSVSKSDFSYEEGTFTYNFETTLDTDKGLYSSTIKVEDIDGYTYTVYPSPEFKIYQASLQLATLEVDKTYTEMGDYKVNLTLKNGKEDIRGANISLKGDVDDIATLEKTSVEVPGNSKKDIVMELDIDREHQWSGEVKATTTGDHQRNMTAEINIKSYGCNHGEGTLCTGNQKFIRTFNQKREYSDTLFVHNKNKTAKKQVSLWIMGDSIKQFVSLSKTSLNIPAGSQDTVDLVYNINSAELNGSHEGQLVLNTSKQTLIVPLDLEVEVQEDQPGLSISADKTDFGLVSKKGTLETDLEIRNQGNTKIENISVTAEGISEATEVGEIMKTELNPGGRVETKLEINAASLLANKYGPNSNPAKVIVQGSENTGDQIRISLQVYDFEANINQIESEIENLNQSLTSKRISGNYNSTDIENVQTDINNLKESLDSIKDDKNNGNLQSAKTNIESLNSEIDQVDSTLRSLNPSSPGDTNDQDGDGIKDESDGCPDENREDCSEGEVFNDGTGCCEQKNDGEGGLPVNIILALIIIVLVGLILYFSLMPEQYEQPDLR